MDGMRILVDVAIVFMAMWMILIANKLQELNRFWTWAKLGTMAIGIGVAVATWLDLAKHVFSNL